MTYIIEVEVLGSKMYLIKDDIGLSADLLGVQGTHRYKEDAAVKEVMINLKPDNICIDIGANLGYYALLEARLCPRGFVYAIEPIKETVDTLKKSIKLNDYNNIKAYQLAIGSQTCKVTMNKSKYSNCGTLCSNIEPKGFVKKIKVNQMSLSDFCKQHEIPRVDFIRMDVEGYETEIIKGMEDMIDLMPMGAILNFEIHHAIISRDYLLKIYNGDTDIVRTEYWRRMNEEIISSLEPFVTLFDNLKRFGFIPIKYTSSRDTIKDISNMEKLRKMVGVNYCSHMFFEKVKGNI